MQANTTCIGVRPVPNPGEDATMATVKGTEFFDIIDAQDGVTNGNDLIFGYGGSDTIHGLGGIDHIYGGYGQDFLHGDAASDYLYGEGDDDYLYGDSGADYLHGGPGIDWVVYFTSPVGVVVDLANGAGFYGHAEGDTLVSIENVSGSTHDDIVVGTGGDNTVRGRDGDDTLKGGGGADTLWGDEDDDYLDGGQGADDLNGGSGVNTLVGGPGGDQLYGEGNDTASYVGSNEGVIVSLMSGAGSHGDAQGDTLSGIDGLIGSGFADDLWGSNWANVLSGQAGNDTLKGFGGFDTLHGGDDHDTLWGMEGADTLNGNNGDDYLDGGVDYDAMAGGLGNDTYIVDHGGDTVTELANQGNDVVHTSISWTLPAGAHVETLRTTDDDGTTPLDLTGNGYDNLMIGNDGANVIRGGNGNDELIGLGGQDSFLFESVPNAMLNVDALSDFNVADDTIVLENAMYAAFAPGPLAANRFFVVGFGSQNSDDNIVYDRTVGAVLYDNDGVGGTAPVQFAQVAPFTDLTAADFLVV